MDFFNNMTELRGNADDVSRLPHRQLASKVFDMSHAMFMKGWDNPMHLRPDVSPEMLESAVARIFGKQTHEQLVVSLPEMQKSIATNCDAGYDADDFYMPCIQSRPLLGEIATKAAWGEPATENVDTITGLLFWLLWDGENVDRFVAQAVKRLTVH